MVQRRSNRGTIIDFDALIAQQGNKPAVGNMKVDAKGNRLGAGGRIIETNEERVRKYYNDTKSDTTKVSVKGAPIKTEVNKTATPPKTAKTAAENVRTAKLAPDVVEPSEFDEPADVPPLEPLGHNEVYLPNGDIEMVPFYAEEDRVTKKGKKK